MEQQNKYVLKDIIKIGVLLNYGEDNVKIICNALKCENTAEKLRAIVSVIDNCKSPMNNEEILFVVQKLLAYPKSVRLSIASQLEDKL